VGEERLAISTICAITRATRPWSRVPKNDWPQNRSNRRRRPAEVQGIWLLSVHRLSVAILLLFSLVCSSLMAPPESPVVAPSSRTGDDLKCLLSEVKPTNTVNSRRAESDPNRPLWCVRLTLLDLSRNDAGVTSASPTLPRGRWAS
jgi:hypothetical protein